MAGTVVQATNLDSVRIEVLGEGRAVTIPARLILAVDAVLRRCTLREVSLEVDLVDDPSAPFQAMLDGGQEGIAQGATAWEAIANLYDRLG